MDLTKDLDYEFVDPKRYQPRCGTKGLSRPPDESQHLWHPLSQSQIEEYWNLKGKLIMDRAKGRKAQAKYRMKQRNKKREAAEANTAAEIESFFAMTPTETKEPSESSLAKDIKDILPSESSLAKDIKDILCALDKVDAAVEAASSKQEKIFAAQEKKSIATAERKKKKKRQHRIPVVESPRVLPEEPKGKRSRMSALLGESCTVSPTDGSPLIFTF